MFLSIHNPSGDMKWFIFYHSSHSWKVLFTGIYKFVFAEVPKWHWKRSPSIAGLFALLEPTRWPTLSGSVSKTHSRWAYVAASQTTKKKLSFNTKISLCSNSCISLCFPVFAPPLIVFRCENVCSTSHSSQSPHSPIKMTFGPYFLFLGLKVLLIFEVCPLDSLESHTSPLRLRSHWTLGSESKFLGLQEV